VQPEEISLLIQAHLPEATVQVTGDDGHHFQATVVSEQFSGLSPVKRQQCVYAAVTHLIQTGALHALSLKTLTPQEWQARGQESHG
jgi:acid stress-induced BolA-like protein IbaG/YrbA